MGGNNRGGNNPSNPNASGYNGGGGSKGGGNGSGSSKSGSGSSSSKSGNGNSGSSGSKSGSGGWGSGGTPGHDKVRPILLDLDGDGVKITELSRSNVFMDSAGDGLLHRTAWAGVGDGVLFYDANFDGKIGEVREYVFTEWDPTASSDLEALRSAFDGNGDGKLTAADISFAKFKVMVTNADGSMTAKSLIELGITEISLKGDASHIELPDGSVITGQAGFRRANGTTGTVADTVLTAEADGRHVVQTVSTDAAGNRTVVSKAYDADGGLASTITSVTAKNGLSVSTSYDDDGDGIADRLQTIVTVVNADGSRRETLTNLTGNALAPASVENRTVTTTSADRRTLTIERDSTGGGWFDQVEVRVKNADGTSSITISDLARDGTLKSRVVETLSADGNVRVEAIDLNGDGVVDVKTRDDYVMVGAQRVNTVAITNPDDSLRSFTQKWESADGRSNWIGTDLDGDKVFETQEKLTIAVAAGGATNSVLEIRNADLSLRSRTEQAQSADTLTKTIKADVDGDGDFDTTTVDATVIAAAGIRTETVTTRNLDGSIREMTRTVLGADKVTSETWEDLNQDGTFQATDKVAAVTVAAGTQARTSVTWDRNPDGSINSTVTAVTTQDGLSTTTTTDADGDGDTDLLVTDVTQKNADGLSLRTVSSLNGDGSSRGSVLVVTSADSLITDTQIDSEGSSALDRRIFDELKINADGSTSHWVTVLSGDSAVRLSQTVTAVSADKLTSTVTIDANGDGAPDVTTTRSEAANGVTTVTTQTFRPNGQMVSRTVTTTDASGLVSGATIDANGDGKNETVISDVTILNADGSRARTLDTNNGDGSNRGLTLIRTSDDGLSVWSHVDLNGDDVADRTTVSTRALNADGSVTDSISTRSTSFKLLQNDTTTTSDDKLTVVHTRDLDGDGSVDWRSTSSKTLGNDGSVTTDVSVHEMRNEAGGTANYASTLRSRAVETVSDDSRHYSLSEDVNGDGAFDRVTLRTIETNGVTNSSVTERSASGALQSRVETWTSANGLLTIQSVDADGNGVYETKNWDSTVLWADGSVWRTLFSFAADGTLFRVQGTTTSDDGTSVVTAFDDDGDGRIDLWKYRSVTLAANGVTTAVATSLAASVQKIFQDTLVTSADKRSVVRTVDENGDGVADWSVNTVTGNDGVTTATTSYFSRANGALQARISVATSQDGLSRFESRDWDANGKADYTIATDVTLGADGSRTTNTVYRDGNGGFWAYDWIWTSDDGLTVQHNIADPARGLDMRQSTAVTYEAGGDVVTRHEVRNYKSQLLSSATLRESGNGLTSQYAVNIDGAGGNERTVDKLSRGDGEFTSFAQSFKTTGELVDSVRTWTSADGRNICRYYDDNGDRKLDRDWYGVTDLSRNTISVFTDYNLAGNGTSRVTVTSSANHALETALLDFDLNGTAELTRTTQRSFEADATATTRFTETAGGRLTYAYTAQTAADGLSTKTTMDIDGDGKADYTTWSSSATHLSGSSTSATYATYADGSLKSYDASAAEADGRNWWSTHDRNGDGVTDVRETGTRDSLGNVFTWRQVFKPDGQLMAQTDTWDSADGFVTRITRSGAYGSKPQTETITRSVLGNGSYVWDNGQPASDSTVRVEGVHTFDSDGNLRWTRTESWREYYDYWVTEYDPYSHKGEGVTITYRVKGYNDHRNVQSATLEQAAVANIYAQAERIYDTLLDRGSSSSEREDLIFSIKDGALDVQDLASRLLGPQNVQGSLAGSARTEFDIRFGQMGNLDFISRLFLNSYGRAPSMGEASAAIMALGASKTEDRARFAAKIASSSEHFAVGNTHLSTNNADLELTPPVREALLDRAAVQSSIERMFDTLFDRAPTPHELGYFAWRMMTEGRTLHEIAGDLRGQSGELFGVSVSSVANLSGRALVEKAYLNATGHLPTAAEADTWTAHLAANRISAEEFLAALSESTEHLAAGNGHASGAAPTLTVTGNDSAQTLSAPGPRTILIGLGGNDTLYGSTGADELRGGLGNDLLIGGAGADRYVWASGDGNDRIDDQSYVGSDGDSLYLAVLPSAVSLAREVGTESYTHHGHTRYRDVETNHLKVMIGNETIIVANQYIGGGIEQIEFADGTVWNISDPRFPIASSGADNLVGDDSRSYLSGQGGNDTLDGRGGPDWMSGGAGDDTLLGGSGDDFLSGGPGADLLVGGQGNDTYEWARGDGKDVLDETVADPGSWWDTLILKDVASADVAVQQSGADAMLVIAPSTLNGSDGGAIRIVNFETPGEQGIDRIVMSDGTWTRGELKALSMRATGTPGNDVITGHSGHDVFSGLGGNDTFVFKGRVGVDQIMDFAAGPGQGDVIHLRLGSAFDSFGEVVSAAHQVGADTVIDFGDLGSLALHNVTLSSLAPDDFVFA